MTLKLDAAEAVTPEAWQRYRQLITKRDGENLSDEEHQELLLLTDQTELAQAGRLELAAELATRRGVSLRSVMREIGIRPRVSD